MRLPSLPWLISAGVVILIAIVLVSTSFTSGSEDGYIQNDEEIVNPKVVRDHWKLSKLLNTMNLNCQMMSGETTSNETVNRIWNLKGTTSIETLISMDLYQLKKDFDTFFDVIQSYRYDENGYQLDTKPIVRALRKIGAVKEVFIWNAIEMERLFSKTKVPNKNWMSYNYFLVKTNKGLQELQDNIGNRSDFDSFYWKTFGWYNIRDNTDLQNIADNIDSLFMFIGKIMNDANDELYRIPKPEEMEKLKSEYDNMKSLILTLKELRPTVPRAQLLSQTITSLIRTKRHQQFIKSSEIVTNEDGFISMLFNDLSNIKNGLLPVRKYLEELANLELQFNVLDKNALKVIEDEISMFAQHKEVTLNRYYLEQSVNLNFCIESVKNNESRVYKQYEADRDTVIGDLAKIMDISDSYSMKNLNKNGFLSYDKVRREITRVWSNIKLPIDLIKQLMETPDYEITKKFIPELIQRVVLLERIEQEIEEEERPIKFLKLIFKYFVNTIDPKCKQSNFDNVTVQSFLSFHKSIGALRNEQVESIINGLLIPLRQSQIRLQNLTSLGSQLSRYSHKTSKRLCDDLSETSQHIENIESGVKNMEKLFKMQKYQKTIDKIHLITDYVIDFVKLNATERNSEVWKIGEWFELIRDKKDELNEMFRQIRHLEHAHHSGKWSNLKSVQLIYEKCQEIKNPIDWIKVNASMDRFYEKTYRANPKLVEVRKLIESMVDIPQIDWISFQRCHDSLEIIDERIEKFEMWQEPRPSFSSWITIDLILGLSLTLLFIGSVHLMVWMSKTRKRKRELTPEDRKDDPDFEVTKDNREFWPQLIQAARLPINERDEDGYTRLFMAVWNQNYEEAEKLIKEGAAIDASCGPDSTTALHISACRGDKRMTDLLLSNGADPKCLDGNGRSCERVCSSKNFTKSSFALNYENRKNQQIPRGIKRDFYVLIVDCQMFPEEDLDLIPNNLEIVYGYRRGEVQLDEFTHFCMRPRSDNAKDIELDLDNLLAFEILSKPGMIVSTEWLYSCIDNISNIDFDYYFLLTDITFEERTHPGVITRIKNDIHRLRPPLLHECELTILSTRNRIMSTDRMDWIRIIESFGGEMRDEPSPPPSSLSSSLSPKLPIHLSKDQRNDEQKSSLYYLENQWREDEPKRRGKWKKKEMLEMMLSKKFPVYPTICLYFSDSVIKERWTLPGNHLTLVGMAWLPQSIVRYSLIPTDHPTLRNETHPRYLTVVYEQGGDRRRWD